MCISKPDISPALGFVKATSKSSTAAMPGLSVTVVGNTGPEEAFDEM
jgi:hypothetical protein